MLSASIERWISKTGMRSSLCWACNFVPGTRFWITIR